MVFGSFGILAGEFSEYISVNSSKHHFQFELHLRRTCRNNAAISLDFSLLDQMHSACFLALLFEPLVNHSVQLSGSLTALT